MDYNLANNTWGWHPETSLESILNEIATHAQDHPEWLRISASYD